jgi:hypothetical protein
MTYTDKKVQAKMNIKFHEPITAYVLLPDGWLPLAFAPASVVLVDRNIVATAKSIAEESKRADIPANKWWFRFLDNKNYTLHPMLAALEGNARRNPTYDEFVREFQQATESLKEVFPSANFVYFDENQYRTVYAIAENMRKRYESDVAFLIDASEHLQMVAPEGKLRTIEDTLLLISRSLDPKPSLFVVLAALSCLYENSKDSAANIGRNILRPKRDYSESSAHNAISDIRALELLLIFQNLHVRPPIYCTRDKALKDFWVAINSTQVVRSEDGFEFKLEFKKELFPRLTNKECESLIERLKLGL